MKIGTVIDKDVLRGLKILSAQVGKPMSVLIQEAIVAYLETPVQYSKKIKFGTVIDKELFHALKIRAKQESRPISDIILEAVIKNS